MEFNTEIIQISGDELVIELSPEHNQIIKDAVDRGMKIRTASEPAVRVGKDLWHQKVSIVGNDLELISFTIEFTRKPIPWYRRAWNWIKEWSKDKDL